jgi:hypothetical protein
VATRRASCFPLLSLELVLLRFGRSFFAAVDSKSLE